MSALRRPMSMADIRDAAVALFFDQGFDGTTLRQIAAKAGCTVGSVYYYIASKESLLESIMRGVLEDLNAEVRSVIGAESSPVERLRAAVIAHIQFHAVRAQEVFVGNTELRSLSPSARARVIAQREDYEGIFTRLIGDVAASDDGTIIDLQVHLFSLLAQAGHVAGWYRPGGRLSLDVVGRDYSDLVLRGLGVSETAR